MSTYKVTYSAYEKGSSTVASEGTSVGRACCGGRCTTGKVDGKWQDVKLVDNWFKDWYCTVNWYFLHIDQKSGDVFHHQTCQAQYGQGRGAVGKISEYKTFTNKVKTMLDNNAMEPIICPNKTCGCGLCATKSSSFVKFQSKILDHVSGVQYNV